MHPYVTCTIILTMMYYIYTALCDELAMITNGMIVYNADMTAPYDVGTVATYSCNPGFELVINPGSEMRTCADAGDGSGATFSGQAPTCEGKISVIMLINKIHICFAFSL